MARLFVIAALGNVLEARWSNPGQGNEPHYAKAGMAETAATNINAHVAEQD